MLSEKENALVKVMGWGTCRICLGNRLANRDIPTGESGLLGAKSEFRCLAGSAP